MTGMLASVNSLIEARLALTMEVDIIDLKQPNQGALGALEIDQINEIVAYVNKACPVSATIGDLPLDPVTIFNAVENVVNTGVDYVKIGFFPDGDWLATLQKLHEKTNDWKEHYQCQLIAVLFADSEPDLALLTALKNHGFSGVMLDTINKQQGSLTQLMTATAIAQFVNAAKKHQLICGLAGSLKIEDIARLLPYQPDYLGFRGALCNDHVRTAQLSETAISNIKRAMAREVAA